MRVQLELSTTGTRATAWSLSAQPSLLSQATQGDDEEFGTIDLEAYGSEDQEFGVSKKRRRQWRLDNKPVCKKAFQRLLGVGNNRMKRVSSTYNGTDLRTLGGSGISFTLRIIVELSLTVIAPAIHMQLVGGMLCASQQQRQQRRERSMEGRVR